MPFPVAGGVHEGLDMVKIGGVAGPVRALKL